MGEDRVSFAEKKNGDVLLPPPSSRQRHSSVISSCSEDAESEDASGCPPTPEEEEEKEEELEYGPGIVNKLRTKFLSISLKQNRGSAMRRSCSMENLLDQDRSSSRGNMFCQNRLVGNGNGNDSDEHKTNIWGNLKRAKSMDTLLMDLLQQPEPPPPAVPLQSDTTDDSSKKEPKIVRRRDGGLLRNGGPTICDEELPKPDTVKTYKRMFEPAESRRGSYSRRPPVLRASAKSGGLSVSKTSNGVSPSSAKVVNGTASSKCKSSAKQSKAQQPDSEPITNNNSSPTPPPLVMNGDDVIKPVCNGGYVKAVPIKIIDNSLCNGKPEKTLESSEVSKKELQNNQKNAIVCNGNSTTTPHKEIIKTEKDYAKPDVKKLVKQTNNKVVNGGDSAITNVVNGIAMTKPKVPPNRPAFIKNVKQGIKIADLNGVEKKLLPALPKSKPTSTVHKKIAEISKPDTNGKIEEPLSPVESRLNGEIKVKEIKLPKSASSENIEPNRKNAEPENPHPDKTTDIITPKKEFEKETNNLDLSDTEKITNSPKSDPVDPKPVKKSSDPITTSMVFDFRGKDVVPHVAVLPVPFGCKALHPKKKPLMVDGKEAPNGVTSDDDDEYHMDYSVPPPSGVIFEGENIKIGKGSILSTRNKDLKIQFDDNVDENTFVYPSESSLLEDGEQQPSLSPTPSTSEVITNGQPPPSKLKTNPAIGSSGAGGLSTYTPSVLRTMDNFEPGMFRPPPPPAPPEKKEESGVQSGEEENTALPPSAAEQEMLKPADPGIISSWSLSAGTSDLLF